MHLIYGSHATPLAAFLEGMVRIFDWGALLLALRRDKRRSFFDDRDPERSSRVVDRYIRAAVGTFESEEADTLAQLPIVPRRGCAIADILLGPVPMDQVIIQYEEIVPGAVDRILGNASERLRTDTQAELKYFDNLCRQGYRGMVAGFVLTLLLAVSALFLVFFDMLWVGITLVGINIMLGVSASVYVSRAGLRRRWFTGEFLPRVFYTGNRYRLENTDRQRRSAI
jgi:uncharacterized membrane protein